MCQMTVNVTVSLRVASLWRAIHCSGYVVGGSDILNSVLYVRLRLHSLECLEDAFIETSR